MCKLPVLIVNYNTPYYVRNVILSLLHHSKNTHIYVFDNSDNGTIFDGSEFDNVTLIDNTKDQFFNRHSQSLNNHGSNMHGKAIQTFIDNSFCDGFILLDSDVILKKDVRELYDDTMIFVGMSDGKRPVPICCYINGKMCRENNICFWKEGCVYWSNEEGLFHDTGHYFGENIKSRQMPYRLVDDIYIYVDHFCGGSWLSEHDETLYEEFLKKNVENFD